MSKKVKGCYNFECERYRKEYKYKDTDNYCTICGSKLVYVCSSFKCFKRVENVESGNTLCEGCKAKHEERKEKTQENINKAKNVA